MFILLTLAPAACGNSRTYLLRSGSRTAHRIDYSYETFNGVERLRAPADAGETLVIRYDATVEKGALTIRVENPRNDTVWETTVQEAQSDTVRLPAERDGTYMILIEGDDTGGSYDVSWDVT
jgi:hypothetical protein